MSFWSRAWCGGSFKPFVCLLLLLFFYISFCYDDDISNLLMTENESFCVFGSF